MPEQPSFYRPRRPEESPVHKILVDYFDEFERVYPERFQERYGFWRPVVGDAVADFLKCGDLREGFARVRCPGCGHSMFVGLSCKRRCVCASCTQKRSLLTAIHVSEDVAAPVPHRQFVFTIPKRFRLYFRFNRDLLRELPPLAWRVILSVHRAVLGRDDVAPGAAMAIQTHGELANWHPHLHAIATDGAFAPDGTFIPMPEMSAEPYLKLWEKAVFDLLLKEGRINQQVVDQMRTWRHSGFSVDKSVRIEAGDAAAIERLTQYIVRCPFSLDRILKVTDEGKVIYKAEKPDCRPFPKLGDARLAYGASRNFEIFDVLDFIAELTQHIPDKGAQLIRYYGWYSNRSRGDRAKEAAPSAAPPAPEVVINEEDTPHRLKAKAKWAALIKKVFEVNPLLCPKCGGQMKIIAFIEKKDQSDVIKRILRHCGLWKDPPARAPPSVATVAGWGQRELEFFDPPDFDILQVAPPDEVYIQADPGDEFPQAL